MLLRGISGFYLFDELRKRLENYTLKYNTTVKENLVRDLNNAAWVLQKAGMIKPFTYAIRIDTVISAGGNL